MPLVHRHRADFLEETAAGVVHKNLQPAKFTVDRFKKTAHRVLPRHVRADAHDAAETAHFFRRFFRRFAGSPTQGHTGPFAEKPLHNGPSNTAGAAGDRRHFALQRFHIR